MSQTQNNSFQLRGNKKSVMYSPVNKFRERNFDDLWQERKRLTQTIGDNFFKTSERYRKNPDRLQKHVAASWALKNSCDYVRPNATQMQNQYQVTENRVPLFKAYNIYENAALGWDDRMNQWEGTNKVKVDAKYQVNDITNYHSSGGVGKGISGQRDHIKGILDRLTKTQQEKGNLTLNNMNDYGNSWKTPALDMKFKQLHGGATAQRFYNKFPIYRVRGEKPPPVGEDIGDKWNKTIDLNQQENHLIVDGMASSKGFAQAVFEKRFKSIDNTPRRFRDKRMEHSKSIIAGSDSRSVHKMVGGTTRRLQSSRREGRNRTIV
jgi:hypothetical protein